MIWAVTIALMALQQPSTGLVEAEVAQVVCEQGDDAARRSCLCDAVRSLDAGTAAEQAWAGAMVLWLNCLPLPATPAPTPPRLPTRQPTAPTATPPDEATPKPSPTPTATASTSSAEPTPPPPPWRRTPSP